MDGEAAGEEDAAAGGGEERVSAREGSAHLLRGAEPSDCRSCCVETQ